jgi:hypothetical protein
MYTRTFVVRVVVPAAIWPFTQVQPLDSILTAEIPSIATDSAYQEQSIPVPKTDRRIR